MRGNTTTVWKALDKHDEDYDREAASVIETVSRRVWGRYERFVELADLTQEAYIIAATQHADAIIGLNYGYVAHRLEQDLMDHCEKAFYIPRNDPGGQIIRPTHSAINQMGRITFNNDGEKTYESTHVSWDKMAEDGDEGEPRIVLYPSDMPGDYTEDQVRILLPAIWDENYAYGLPDREDAPDQGMPKTASNKARANNHWAMIADIKTGWNKTSLTHLERRALIMVYGGGWAHIDAANYEGVSRPAISVRIDTAVKKITAHLNGVRTEEEN